MGTTNLPNGLTTDLTGGLYLQGTTTVSADGAITIEPGILKITKAGICALTLANPTTAQEGLIMCIISTTANAHTVTNTAGFGDLSTAGDVATFGAAKGNSLTIIAMGQRWYVLAAYNVTIA